MPLEQYPEALDRFAAGKGRKIVVTPVRCSESPLQSAAVHSNPEECRSP
jgi:hypothetical protein